MVNKHITPEERGKIIDELVDLLIQYYQEAIRIKEKDGKTQFILDGIYYTQDKLSTKYLVDRYDGNWSMLMNFHLAKEPIKKLFDQILLKDLDMDHNILLDLVIEEMIDQEIFNENIRIEKVSSLKYRSMIPRYFNDNRYVMFLVIHLEKNKKTRLNLKLF